MNNQITTTNQKEYSLSLTTVKAYNSQIQSFKNTGKPETFDNLKEWITESNTPETYNLRIKAIKAALIADAKRRGKDSTLLKMELAERFKLEGLKTVKIDPSITEDDYLTIDETRALIAAAPEKTSLIIRALYETACRVSELLSLRFDMASETKGGLSFSITGKGDKVRSVYLSEKLYRDIKKTFNGSRFLFVNIKDKPLSRQYVHRLISQAGADVLKIKGLHPHSIRHTFATNNLERLGLHKVKEYLGHADISTTSKFYLHGKPTADDILQGDI